MIALNILIKSNPHFLPSSSSHLFLYLSISMSSPCFFFYLFFFLRHLVHTVLSVWSMCIGPCNGKQVSFQEVHRYRKLPELQQPEISNSFSGSNIISSWLILTDSIFFGILCMKKQLLWAHACFQCPANNSFLQKLTTFGSYDLAPIAPGWSVSFTC